MRQVCAGLTVKLTASTHTLALKRRRQADATDVINCRADITEGESRKPGMRGSKGRLASATM
eukprot:scaffold656056_cov74-Prasinocladus_malaysianus.AAC.2